MAVTVVSRDEQYTSTGRMMERIELSGLTAGETEAVAHNGPASLEVDRVTLQVKTGATSGSPVILGVWSTDTTNDELDIKFETETGGDLTGAVVYIFLEWKHAARQDGQSINQDNP